MAGRTLPGNLGLTGDWDLGENNWKDANDLNLIILSVMAQGSVLSIVAAEPGAPTNGDIHILDETHATHPNAIAVRDEGAWIYIPPETGLSLFNLDDDQRYQFDGATWEVFSSGGGGGSGVPSGVAFPGAPAAGDMFFRTDRGLVYYYDGTQWLTTQLYCMSFTHALNINVTTTVYGAVPYQGTYSIYLERFEAAMLRIAAGEWDVVLQWSSATNVATTLVTLDGAGDTANNWYTKSSAIGAVLNAGARELQVQYTEVSGATNFYGQANLYYRLVG